MIAVALLHYVSHPNVVIDPERPVPLWSLSDEGRRRANEMLRAPWISDIDTVVSSEETKAQETATILADHLGLTVELRAALGEIDRSSTGYVPHDRHHDLALRCFAEPESSADGWERAVDAQRRIVDAVADLLADGRGRADARDIAVIGHGGVGTLLYCQLAGLDIDRRHDQPGQGHFWTYDCRAERIVSGWAPIDQQR